MEIEEQVNDRWLLSFNENLEKVEATQGFVIQIQQGVQREKSFMQIAEEKMARWLKVPRIGIYSFETETVVFPSNSFQIAKEKAQEQWDKKEISPEVVMCNEIFEPLVEGQKLPVDEDGKITGMARCIFATGEVYEGDFVRNEMEGRGKYSFPCGETYEGQYHQGQRHGTGRTTYPSGNTHEGEYAHGKRHGRGIYRWADGLVGAVVLDQDKLKGTWVRRTAAGTFEKFLDDKMVKEVSETEAKKIIQEHRLDSPW